MVLINTPYPVIKIKNSLPYNDPFVLRKPIHLAPPIRLRSTLWSCTLRPQTTFMQGRVCLCFAIINST